MTIIFDRKTHRPLIVAKPQIKSARVAKCFICEEELSEHTPLGPGWEKFLAELVGYPLARTVSPTTGDIELITTHPKFSEVQVDGFIPEYDVRFNGDPEGVLASITLELRATPKTQLKTTENSDVKPTGH